MPKTRPKCLLPLLAVLLFSLPVIANAAGATCTDAFFRQWTNGKGTGPTIPGAVITATIEDIPLYQNPGGKPLGKSIPFAKSYAVTEIDTYGNGVWLRLRGPQPQWFDARTDGLICEKMRPIRAGADRLALKAVAGLGVDRLGKRLQGNNAPRLDAARISNISVYRHYFVFAKRRGDRHPGCQAVERKAGNREWWLLGKKQFPSMRDSGLVGWFPACRLIIWKTRQAVRPVKNAVIRLAKTGKEIATSLATESDKVFFALLEDTGPDYRVAFYGAGDGGVSYQEEAAVGRATAQVYPRYENPLVVFLVDGTSSTRPHLAYMRQALRSIQGELSRQYGNNIRYALAAYRDAKHGIKRHFQVYSRPTSNLEMLLNARLPALQHDTRAWSPPFGDDFREDLFYGLVRVLEDLLPRSQRKRTLPIIVVLGDMGSHERSVNFNQLAGMQDEAVHLIFFQTPADHGAVSEDKRAAYDAAYKAFNEQVNRLRDRKVFTVMGPHIGLQPKAIGRAVANDLQTMARIGKEAPVVIGNIVTGAAVTEALKVVGWPVEWQSGFIAALKQAGFPTQYIGKRRFQMVVPALVSKGQVEVRVLIDKDDLRRWTTVLEALAVNPEMWESDSLARQLGDALEEVAGERPDKNEPLSLFLSRTLDLPVKTEFLRHSLTEIEEMSPQELTRQFDYLSHVVERFRMIDNGVIRDSRREMDPLTGEIFWAFYDRERPYDPWLPAGNRRWIAYLPIEYLP
uniref:VWFA domain-containing protein n=1 Tax=Candidatus Kentrum sp. MB TaxID=2138164 RepID=A0A450X0A4_9GAMM|nr:MAG: hypothetical protein BECKMB1821G_GA0114241_1002103 [Candidatus Kentron sp. MB]